MQKNLFKFIIILVSVVFMVAFTSCTGSKKATVTDSTTIPKEEPKAETPVEPETETQTTDTQQIAFSGGSTPQQQSAFNSFQY